MMTRANNNTLLKILYAVAIPVVFFAALKIAFPANITFVTITNILYQAVAPAIIAWGVSFDLKSGNWDFSVGAAAMTSAIIGGNLAVMLNWGVVGLFICCPLIGLLCGLFTGTLYIWLKVPSIIVSIGVVFLLESFCKLVFGGDGIVLPKHLVIINSFIPLLIIGIVVGIVTYYLYYYRPIGYHVRAVGSNAGISAQSGINVYKVKFYSFLIAGLFAGIYSVVTLGSTGVTKTVSASMGTLFLCFDAMMCVFIGMSLNRFMNLIIGIFVGAVTLQLLKLALMLSGFESSYNQIVVAVFVLVFMSVSSRAELKKLANSVRQRIKTTPA